ncbi:MAG: branched chain amino acid aminotransferase [Candidatus Hydromicrobium americanum]|nr:MAG: branched chain amino acid aminotransferase [Candidatus Hydromicrobium americanum]
MANPKYAFFEGKIVPIDQAKIDIRTNALQYGTGVFEGIRSYWNEKTKISHVFRMEDHYRRLIINSSIMMIEIKYSIKELCDITIELLKKEMYTEDCYIRPFAYNSGLDIGPKLIGNKQNLFIYSIPLGEYLDTSRAISVCISSWERISDNAIPPRAKISGSYVNAALQKTEALLNGFDEALVLTADGKHVSEGSAMNVFMVKNGTLITPPVTDDILEGITRDTVIKLAREDENIKVIERSIDRTELYTSDELFFCGTGAQISPIGYVDKRPVGNGEMGPITKRLQDLYFRLVKNEVSKYSDWCQKV